MVGQHYKYIIVGGGLAGASAISGIRERDHQGSILLIGNERHLPYDRPPLSKKLWFGKKKVEEIYVHNQEFYDERHCQLLLGVKATGLTPRQKIVTDDKGGNYSYEKLLLATGGEPRPLSIPGGDLEGICYYRYLDDYLRLRKEAGDGKSATVIGGGFIGSEIAAALSINKVNVTMIYPAAYLVSRVFPEYLGRALQKAYQDHGIQILSGDAPAAFAKKGGQFVTTTKNGKTVKTDMLIVGVGIAPDIKLANDAGLVTGNGIVVNEFLQTSHPDVYAAGDNTFFPYLALGQRMRVEHWDNALNQGKWAGWNMAGAQKPFNYMPYFFSDLFEFGYEAVGEVNGELETFADWQKENATGVIYYLKDGQLRGVMLCNVWEKVDAARELIRKGGTRTPESLRGAVH